MNRFTICSLLLSCAFVTLASRLTAESPEWPLNAPERAYTWSDDFNHGLLPPTWLYPSYRTPYAPGSAMRTEPLPGPALPASEAHPYPPGYVEGPFTPLPFKNYNPQAAPNRGTIQVYLPSPDAAVFLNGQPMRGSGLQRQFTTTVRPTNEAWQYMVTATYEEDGRTVTRVRKLHLGAGDYAVADFTRPAFHNPINLPAGVVDQDQVDHSQVRPGR